MNKRIIALTGSILIFIVGFLRTLTESLASTPLFVAYVFMITGLIGIIANGFQLKKSSNS